MIKRSIYVIVVYPPEILLKLTLYYLTFYLYSIKVRRKTMDTNPSRTKKGTDRIKEIGSKQYTLLNTLSESPGEWHKLANINLDENTRGRNHKYYLVKDYKNRGFIRRKKEGRFVYVQITALGIAFKQYHDFSVKWDREGLDKQELVQYHDLKSKLRNMGFKFMDDEQQKYVK